MARQLDMIATAGAKQTNYQLHLATRMDRRDSHARLRLVDDQHMLVSMLSIQGCYVCHKSMFEILDGVGGGKCNVHTALKATYEDAPGKSEG